MILEVWELTGYVVGQKEKVFTSISIYLAFHHLWNGNKRCQCMGKNKKRFFRNDNQIQWEKSVRCGYYFLLFLNERNKGTSFADILKMFSNDLLQNEEIVKKYFS